MELGSPSYGLGIRMGHLLASPKIFSPFKSQVLFSALAARPRGKSTRKRPSWCMVYDGYAGTGSLGVGNNSGSFANAVTGNSRAKIYRRLGSCLVIPPHNGRKPRGIIKFLGGAFIGAVPEVTYRSLHFLPWFPSRSRLLIDSLIGHCSSGYSFFESSEFCYCCRCLQLLYRALSKGRIFNHLSALQCHVWSRPSC